MSETSAIDGKKSESESDNNENLASNIGMFILSLVIIIIIILCNFGLGGCVLYMCKIAQSNLFPTQENCLPYESKDSEVQSIKTNIFVTFTDPPLSEKISFSYSKNKKSTILDILREYKEKSNSSFLVNYFITIIEKLTVCNFSLLNAFFDILNQAPEVFILIFGPILLIAYSIFINIVDILYLIYLWFSNMTWFLKTNTNTEESGKPKWETSINPINLLIAWWLFVLFFIMFLIGMGTGLFSLNIALLLGFCLFTILSYTGEMNSKEVTILAVLKDLYKNYKVTITSIITFFVILNSFATLGGLPGLFSILTVGLIFFGIISISIFEPIPQTNLSPIVSYKQATKTCKAEVKSQGFLKSLFQKGGNNLSKEIKKIGKKLTNQNK